MNMEKNKEIEYKILLDEATFQRLVDDFPDAHVYTQTNYYLTSAALDQRLFSFRMREKEGSYEMTLKTPLANGRMEHNIDITADAFQKVRDGYMPDNEITQILISEGIALDDIKQAYSLKTIRHDIPLTYGMLSLDENFYLDRHDYEFEFEINDEENGPKQFEELLQKYHLTYQENTPSKIKRVLDAL